MNPYALLSASEDTHQTETNSYHYDAEMDLYSDAVESSSDHDPEVYGFPESELDDEARYPQPSISEYLDDGWWTDYSDTTQEWDGADYDYLYDYYKGKSFDAADYEMVE